MSKSAIEKTTTMIIDFIKKSILELSKDGAVIGLSGGLDSAVIASLSVHALGAENVHLLYMPERDSNKLHQKHAKLLADALGCVFIRKPISRILKACHSYSLLPIGFAPTRTLRKRLVQYGKDHLLNDRENHILAARLQSSANSWEARANAYAMAKHRVRMVVIYQYAELNNLMVIGAANRTEWYTGAFSQFGVDHCADLMPILHLYRSEVEELAEYLGIPDGIRNKKADPDILPGVEDKQELLGNFKLVDQILMSIENKDSKEKMKQQFDSVLVDTISRLRVLSEPMRSSPYSIRRII